MSRSPIEDNELELPYLATKDNFVLAAAIKGKAMYVIHLSCRAICITELMDDGRPTVPARCAACGRLAPDSLHNIRTLLYKCSK